LGADIDWLKDYKTNIRWELAYFRDIEYCNLERASDVKFPWEMSRMQWLIPVAQLYQLTKQEKYAEKVKSILSDWIDKNPIGRSVNWSCTMEVAMRIFVWTWFFYIFCHSLAWKDRRFRKKFLLNLYWHGRFTEQFIEKSDINGNHYTADASALVVAGLFWQDSKLAARWLKKGWDGLLFEIDRQIYPDGVNFEASTAYHRLVAELFFIAAKYRLERGFDVPNFYLDHLRKMGEYSQAYTRVDGTCPLWGDADDARVLPFGLQEINDHRYLPCLIGKLLNDNTLLRYTPGDYQELIWWYGLNSIRHLSSIDNLSSICAAFDDGGFYIIRNKKDHLFIDCGPVGLANRGGHGHNDCLGFSLVLRGCELITDRGVGCYTGSYIKRNEFRSTSSHNTPLIDGQEINRFIAPDYLWNFHYEAKPSVISFEKKQSKCVFIGSHEGYKKLDSPVVPIRKIVYNSVQGAVDIEDELQGSGKHSIEIPLYFASSVTIIKNPLGYELQCGAEKFQLTFNSDAAFNEKLLATTISPSYDVEIESRKLVWSYTGNLPVKLTVKIYPLSRGND